MAPICIGGSMASIGEELRRERQRRGYTLEQVEDVLHIKVAYLHALEHNEFNQIPGSIYIKGFVKNYSEFLGIDSRRMVDAFKNSIGESLTIPKRRISAKGQDKSEIGREQDILEEPKQRLTYQGRRARRQRTLMKERIILVVLLLIIALFLGWLFFV